MRQTWRWFGPHDTARIEDVVQAGAEGVVSALHHVPNGVVWTPEEIAKRQNEVAHTSTGAPSGIAWDVIESLPVSEDIKKQKGPWREHIANYKTSMRNVAAAGLEVICYNFMPVLDWTRTDLRYRVPSGATCMRFDIYDFAVFDIHLLGRPGAAEDYGAEVAAEAAKRVARMSDDEKAARAKTITTALPGSTETMTMDRVREHLAEYGDISPDQLRKHFVDFLEEIIPVAEEVGIRMCCHPDDPPFSLLGLPRIMSTADDYARILDAVESPANGMTLCSGSLGARPDNDLPAIMRRFGPKVHFLHLRNVRRDEPERMVGSFFEDEHLAGNTDMVALIAAIVSEERRRKAEGRADHQIPMRPDHGQDIVDDLNRRSQPGYPTVGRLKGLAELRGVMTALEHAQFGLSR